MSRKRGMLVLLGGALALMIAVVSGFTGLECARPVEIATVLGGAISADAAFTSAIYQLRADARERQRA